MEKSKVREFQNMCAQGDTLFRRIASLPEDAKEVVPEKPGQVIVTHSETGHHHLFHATPSVVQLFGSGDPMKGYLRVHAPVVLEHARSVDSHDPIKFEPGCYEVLRQEEFTPEGWRRVID